PLGLRLTRRLGADVVFTGSGERVSVDTRLEEVAAKLSTDGRVPYVIPRGGASAVGAVGYAVAAAELAGQLAAAGVARATVLLATGSCGTQPGLVAGDGWRRPPRFRPGGHRRRRQPAGGLHRRRLRETVLRMRRDGKAGPADGG